MYYSAKAQMQLLNIHQEPPCCINTIRPKVTIKDQITQFHWKPDSTSHNNCQDKA